MNSRFFNRTIGRKLTTGFVIILTLLVITSAVGILGVISVRNTVQTNLDQGIQINDLSLKAKNTLLTARRHEKDFMLRYTTEGIDKATANYANLVAPAVGDLRSQINSLIAVETQSGLTSQAAALKTVAQSLDTYETSFQQVAALIQQRGTVDDGLIGAFRSAAHNVEAEITSANNAALMVNYLEIRRNEKDYLARFDPKYVKSVEDFVAQLKPQLSSTGQANLDEYLKDFEAVVAADSKIASETQAFRDAAHNVESVLEPLDQQGAEQAQAAKTAIYDRAGFILMLLVALMPITVVLGLLLSWLIGRSIVNPLRTITDTTERFAQGDLDQRVTFTGSDELGRLARAFNEMAANLQQMFGERVSKEYLEQMVTNYRNFVAKVADGNLQARLDVTVDDSEDANRDDLVQLGLNLNQMVEGLSELTQRMREAASGVSAAAAEILAATTQQIAGATEQDAAVTQTMTTVEEVRVTVRQTAERAQAVAQSSRQSVDISRTGQNAVVDTVDGMQVIRQRVESIAETILMLSERTQQIGEIIATVNEIADQSKLLALNASIEAARAGEEGKGFAVVAMEVRQLAEQSRDATARVRGILSEIQQATNTAVMVTEEGSKGADSGMKLVDRAGEAIRELSATIEEASQAAMQIAASTHQQTSGMDQLATAMISIKQATTQTAASTRQAERSAQDLNEMAHQMQQIVARYKI
jgi:methyl-accepting chemotaxis protein